MMWGEEALPNFKAFWTFLNERCDLNKCCPGCRQGGGYPGCEIRRCAERRKIDICVNCGEYPCTLVTEFSKIYPTLIADGQRLKEIGVEAWIQEQKKRAETGFVYADIRNSR